MENMLFSSTQERYYGLLYYNLWAIRIEMGKDPKRRPYGHRELIIYPIDSNGDPHGLWQFIVHLTMNVGHHNMP